VVPARHGRGALEQVVHQAFAVILTDLALRSRRPGMVSSSSTDIATRRTRSS
jgi:hypothetical protein